MVLSKFTGRLALRLAPLMILFQGLAVLALPAALCCCLAVMMAERDADGHAVHRLGSADASGGDEDCPHHDLARPVNNESNPAGPGCDWVDQMVLVLSGLIGVTTAEFDSVAELNELGTLSSITYKAITFFPPVESPPPRA